MREYNGSCNGARSGNCLLIVLEGEKPNGEMDRVGKDGGRERGRDKRQGNKEGKEGGEGENGKGL